MVSLLRSCLVACVLSLTAGSAVPETNTSLPTLSGISAGGFFAVQMHVAFSSCVGGVGVVAGGPFYCAMGNIATAEAACMKTPGLISVAALVQISRNTAATGTIDSLEHLKHHRAYLFSGTKDTVVAPGVMSKLEQYYLAVGLSPDDLATQFGVPAEHSFVTARYGSNCSFLGQPYINNCGYDTAGNMLQHLYSGMLLPAQAADASRILSFPQAQFLPIGYTLVTAALGELGYAYVPAACEERSVCRVHVAFHGCLQDATLNEAAFVKHAGYNEWAQANKIIVVYPQSRKTVLNPKGCFDWWGYTGVDYASKLGAQMHAVKKMLESFQ